MANDSVDGVNKVSQDLAALHDKDSLHTAMQDLQHLKGQDTLADKDGSKGIFKQDLAQIAKSVDLKGLGLDGFHVTGYGETKDHQFLQATKDGTNPGDKPVVKALDQDGKIYDIVGDHIQANGQTVFAVEAAPAPAPAKVSGDGTDVAPAPAKVAGDGTDVAPAPAAAAADNSFGAHGRTYEVNADGKAFYPAKHGDTYWAVARDLLTKPDHKPNDTEILAQVKALATLNNKSDAGKLKIGEPILLPITPAAPEAAKTPPEAAKTPPEAAKTPPEAAGPVGFNLKDHADALKPQNDVYNPLSPLGMSGAGPDADKATLAGDASKPEVKGTVSTQETNLNLKDGSAWLFGYGRTGVTNTDVTDGNILKSRDTKYDSGVSMKIAGPKGPVALDGVTHIVTKLQDSGNYNTDVTAADGVHHFVTDASGKVQRSVDQTGKVALLEAPSETVLASLSLDTSVPTAPPPKVVADAGAITKVDAPKPTTLTDAVDPP